MAEPTPRVYVPSPGAGALRQGEILSDVVEPKIPVALDQSGPPIVHLLEHSFCVVVSQDCDLEREYARRSAEPPQGSAALPRDFDLPNVLLCEVSAAERVKARPGLNSKVWQRVQQNDHERYHFLQAAPKPEDLHEGGLPELTVDFRRYFTLPTTLLYRQIEDGFAQRRTVLASPYLEHFCRRFANYLSRVALPAPHCSE